VIEHRWGVKAAPGDELVLQTCSACERQRRELEQRLLEEGIEHTIPERNHLFETLNGALEGIWKEGNHVTVHDVQFEIAGKPAQASFHGRIVETSRLTRNEEAPVGFEASIRVLLFSRADINFQQVTGLEQDNQGRRVLTIAFPFIQDKMFTGTGKNKKTTSCLRCRSNLDCRKHTLQFTWL
jgi:hypothetical protein